MNEVFIKRLQTSMDQSKINQSELSELSGISKQRISGYLKGEYEPKSKPIYALAKALGVSASWLMGLNEGVPSTPPTSFTDEEYQHRHEKAVKKFGVYYPQAERDKISKVMTAILATNPGLKAQIECQTEILKCCFSESLEQNNFDLRHCSFKDYVAMVLDQHVSAIPMSDECIYEMAEIYGRLPGMSEGIIYDIPPETREERRLRHIMESVQKLNEEGQLKVHDFVNYLADSGKYNKPDTDDDKTE